MKANILKPIEYIMKFAKKESLQGFYTADGNKRIGRDDFSGLYRVFNEGRGRLKLVDFHNEILYINNMLLSKSELKNLKGSLSKENIKYAIVNFGYPDYYAKSIYQMKVLEQN